MLKSVAGAWRRLRRDESGNIAIIFGASAVPLLLIMGGAVDISRYTRYKAELTSAADTAALALVRKASDFPECTQAGTACPAAATFVSDYIATLQVVDNAFTIDGEAGVAVTKIANGFDVAVTGTMDTIFLPLGNMAQIGDGIRSMDVHATSQVVAASNRLEVALVLDNTGSMNCEDTVDLYCAADWSSPPEGSRITALKSAANRLVDTLMRDDLSNPDQVKIALVPFESQVNVASTGFDTTNPPSWIDWADEAKAKWNGRNVDTYNVVGSPTKERVGHKWLFNKLTADTPALKWAGCVEMRAGSYELTDAVPNAGVVDSLYVPFFWPDEPDDANGGGNNAYGTPKYHNNYLKDRTSPPGTPTEKAIAAQKFTKKYSSNSEIQPTTGLTLDTDATTTPYENGPNRGCPKPIVPLTNADGKATLKNAITGMIAYWASGTYIPAGLIWGWHTLSDDLPYTEGLGEGDENFENTVKAIILLTDGENEVFDLDGGHNGSRFSAYGYVKTVGTSTTDYRLGAGTAATAEAALNTKTATLCENVKGDNIRLYTISFGTLAEETTALMETCATDDEGDRLYYHAPTPDDLDAIFAAIGEDLNNLHLAR